MQLYGAQEDEQRELQVHVSYFHKLDPNTPVTIGCATVQGMKDLAEYVDVLQFHDYSDTREGIRNSINKARLFAKEVKKPVFNGEMCCIARANPYRST